EAMVKAVVADIAGAVRQAGAA
ncbi:MAG: hypothetical protein JWM33_2633, partial [Caulobacteraceae bacterium]|nr:hypothetical protein [Caulobacteraceae bacterium]